jgi:translation initiation factor 3 subunit B
VEAREGLDSCIVVDGIPIIDEPKRERLLTKLGKEFTKRGCPYPPQNTHMPWDDATGKSKGCVFTLSVVSRKLG